MVSAAGSDIIEAFSRISKLLSCPLIIMPIPENFFEPGTEQNKPDEATRRRAQLIIKLARHLYAKVIPQGAKRWGEQIARVP